MKILALTGWTAFVATAAIAVLLYLRPAPDTNEIISALPTSPVGFPLLPGVGKIGVVVSTRTGPMVEPGPVRVAAERVFADDGMTVVSAGGIDGVFEAEVGAIEMPNGGVVMFVATGLYRVAVVTPGPHKGKAKVWERHSVKVFDRPPLQGRVEAEMADHARTLVAEFKKLKK